MKKWIAGVIIIIAIIMASYVGMGMLTERAIKKNVAVINDSNGIVVEIQKYHRGWYRSSAVLHWHFHIPLRSVKGQDGKDIVIPAKDYDALMPITVYHGPVMWVGAYPRLGLGYAVSDVDMPRLYADKFAETFTADSIKPTLKFRLFVDYWGISQLDVTLPSFKLIAKAGGEQLDFQGVTSQLLLSSGEGRVEGNVSLAGIQFTKDKLKAVVGNVTGQYHLHKTDADIYLGDAGFSLPLFSFTGNDQPIFVIEQLTAASDSDIKDQLFYSHMTTSFNKLNWQGRTYGPAVLELSIKNIDANVLADINQQANKMQQGSDEARQQALLALLPKLPLLFSKGAQFEVSKLSIAVPEGLIEGNLLLSLAVGDTKNPFQLLQNMQGHGKLKLPAVMLKEALVATARQKLLGQALVQEAKKDSASAPASAPVAKPDGSSVSTENNSAAVVVQDNPINPAQLQKEAVDAASRQIDGMVTSGMLVSQGTEYVVEVTLAQGQLLINGKPFTSAMLPLF